MRKTSVPTAKSDMETTLALTAQAQAEAGVGPLSRLRTPVWIADFDALAIVWANAAALELWSATDVEELARRDLRTGMSETVSMRLRQYAEDLERDPTREFIETWTLYPQDKPTLIELTFRATLISSERRFAEIEARKISALSEDFATLRAHGALLHAEIMVGLYDRDGGELFASRAWRAALGPGGRPFRDWVKSEGDADVFSRAFERREPIQRVVLVETVRGEKWFDLRLTPCTDAATGDEAMQLTAIDVTLSRRFADDVIAARDEARAASRAKSDFMAKMSHEMRTPMNGVLGMLELIRNADLGEEQRAMVEVARASGADLLDLIEDALDLSCIELGAYALNEERFDAAAVARAVAAGLADPARRKGLALEVEIGPDLAGAATGDRCKLAQVMRNLIANAIKYTEAGGVTVIAARVGDDLRIEVRDTGPGVPDARKGAIFQRFHQERAGASDGVGLGLAICSEIVALWGGELGVGDNEGGGALFWFTAPRVFAGDAFNAA